MAVAPGRLYERLAGTMRDVARWGAEVVYVNQGSVLELMFRGDVRRLLRMIGAPYGIVCHYNTDRPVPGLDDRSRRETAAYFEGAAWVGFVAEENLRTARRQLATPLANGRVVRAIGLKQLDLTPPPRPALPWRMACVSRVEVSDKGQDILLEVLGGAAWRDRDWRVRLYGHGRDRDYLGQLAEFYGIADRVEFPGYASDIAALWADNHLLALPSRAEGTPAAMVEAMTCGRPVVATDVGGNAEWVDEPATGFLAEAPTLRSFGAALERAWGMREHWEAMGVAAHRAVVGRMGRDPAPPLLALLVETAAAGGTR